MTPEMQDKLKRSLVKHEGWKRFPYMDTMNNITIGCGYNLSARGVDDEWISKQYNQDIAYFYLQLNNHFPWFKNLNEDRQICLIDMCYNLGYKKFLEFHDLIAALENEDYNKAGYEMLTSQWHKQVNSRAADLAQGMITGTYHV